MDAARTGPELIRASKPFALEDPATTWRLFLDTLLVVGLCTAVVLTPTLGPLRWIASVVLGLTNVRLFIFYHDAVHGAIFQKSRLGLAIMWIYGILTMTPWAIWRESHNYHHNHTSKVVGSSIGSYPILTVGMYRALSPLERFGYRLTRHWLTITFGYFTIFIAGMLLKPFIKNPRQNWECALSLIVQLGGQALAFWLLPPATAFLLVFLPMLVSCASGAYLFYAQHNYPDMVIRDRQTWEYTAAALYSSSMIKTGPILRWLTGDIGFHHVHHLNHKIPFYRLEEAMKGIPELKTPGVTTLKPKAIAACFRLALWDPEQARMISFAEARESPHMPTGASIGAR